jgi:hypothetical protein
VQLMVFNPAGVQGEGEEIVLVNPVVYRDGNGSGRAITRPLAKRLRVEIHTRAHTHG